jgi:prepilin-type N-terminal cleavage/methylation domain-containing protein
VPNDHRGITLVELIIAIAISTVILGAATLFLGMAHKNYNHASAD